MRHLELTKITEKGSRITAGGGGGELLFNKYRASVLQGEEISRD